MSNNRKKIAVILVAFLFTIISVEYSFAEYSANFKNISIREGLSQSTVQTIYQDSKGYMWLGSNDGLNRYDGHNIKIYKSEDGNNSISDNYILNITEDNKKNLWISTVNGLTKINIDSWDINTYFEKEYEGNLSDNFVNTTLVTKDGNILAGTSDGINIYNEKTDSFQQILNDKDLISNQNIKSMVEDNNGDIWIGTKEGINKINIKEQKIEKFCDNKEIDTLLFDTNGYIWASTPGNGLIKIDIDTGDLKSYLHSEEDEKSLPSNYTKKMYQDRQGNVWIATESGVAKYTYDRDNFYIYKNKSYDTNSLINNFTYSVFEDMTGLIWVGTYSGVSVFDPNNKIEHYKYNPFDENSISENMIHGIYEDDEGLVWVGTQNKGLNIINREDGSVNRIVKGTSKYNLNCDNIKVITGKDNKIWVGTREGLNEINKDDMSVKVYTSEDNLAGSNIKSLLLDSKGYLWIGTPDGLSVLNTKDDSIINLTYIFDYLGIRDTYVEDIYEDDNGDYWIGMFLGGGLIHVEVEKSKITSLSTEELHMGKSNMKSIRSITGDKNDNLWIGTSDGLIKYNIKDKAINTYTTKDGLSNNTVYGVIIDDEGTLWMSTNDGISSLDANTGTFKDFNINDGLQSNEFNGKAYYKSKSGELFFGGINGLNIFDSDKLLKKEYYPDIVFDNFEVEGRAYSNIDDLTFSHDKNLIRIKYFVPNYRYDNDVNFQYRLVGQSDEWININSNEAIFSKLEPGKYVFEIRYLNSLGKFSEIKSVKFSIDPPFWKSNFAMMLYVMLLIIGAYILRYRVKTLDTLVDMRTQQLSKEMEKSNKLLNQVIALERKKNNYFVNLSHELRTPLNVISSIEQLVTEFNKTEDGIDRDKLDYYMGIMRRNTRRLLNLINNIIDTNKIEHGSFKIDMKYHDIVYIVEETALAMKDYIESKGIKLVIDTDIEEKMVWCGSDEIERCIINLVSNAAKFTPEGGTIEVSICDLDTKVRITVSDTGIGIDEKFHKFIFDRFNQVVDSSTEAKGGSGLGLTITKHIVDLHGGIIYVNSKKNKGSKFTIIIPVEKE